MISDAARACFATLGPDVLVDIVQSGRESEITAEFAQHLAEMTDAEICSEWGVTSGMLPMFRNFQHVAEALG